MEALRRAHISPTKTGVAIAIEAPRALAEVGTNDVAAVGVGVTAVLARCTLILIWGSEEKGGEEEQSNRE